VLGGRQFNLSHIAQVLLDNATSLLVSTSRPDAAAAAADALGLNIV